MRCRPHALRKKENEEGYPPPQFTVESQRVWDREGLGQSPSGVRGVASASAKNVSDFAAFYIRKPNRRNGTVGARHDLQPWALLLTAKPIEILFGDQTRMDTKTMY